MKNFIEVTGYYEDHVLININNIEYIRPSTGENKVRTLVCTNSAEIYCKESYQEVKKLIEESQFSL